MTKDSFKTQLKNVNSDLTDEQATTIADTFWDTVGNNTKADAFVASDATVAAKFVLGCVTDDSGDLDSDLTIGTTTAGQFVSEFSDGTAAAEFVSSTTKDGSPDPTVAAEFVRSAILHESGIDAFELKKFYDKGLREGLQAAPLIAQGTIKLNTNTYLVNTHENAINNYVPVANCNIVLPSIKEDTTLEFTTNDLLTGVTDQDGNTLTIVGDLDFVVGNGTITGDSTDGWTFTPAENFNGEVKLLYTVSDGVNNINVTASFQVFAVNDLPSDSNPGHQIGSMDEDATFKFGAADILVGITDNEQDISKLSITLIATNGTIEYNADIYTYTPNANFNGDEIIKVIVNDSNGGIMCNQQIQVESVHDDKKY